MRRHAIASALPLLAGLLLAACAASGDVVGPGDMTLSVQNGTTTPVTLFVTGVRVRDVAPGAIVELPASALPSLPWHAEVRLPTGRLLVSLTINAGDVIQGPSSAKGDAARVDLSCGRIDIWSGPPLLGPASGPGTPGDCDP
jgi:hypothetical protein